VTTAAAFEELLTALVAACVRRYGERLVTLIVFGSVGRGTPRPDSDVDILVVADPLPDGRMARVAEFDAVERDLAPALERARASGVETTLSPLFKTPAEAARGSPLFLDFVDDARLLVDRGAFFAGVLDRLRARLAALGARRVWRGARWYWDLKPDFRPGDVVEL
jgi:predicted nucleotidyltransferase